MNILAVQNCEVEGFGLYEEIIRESGNKFHLLEAYKDNNFDDPAKYDAVLVGGTPISVSKIAEHNFLTEEREFLREAMQKNIPCFGICFGAQLLASIYGGKVRSLLRKEIGCYAIIITEDGVKDPLLNGFPGTIPAFQWHGDTFELPEGSVLLAEGVQCINQLFRIKNSIGVQFHLEVTKGDAEKWADAYSDELSEFGGSFDKIVQGCDINSKKMKFLASLLMNNFLHYYVKDIIIS
jgi:GMP synthase-like glutamine amidotransferase